MGAEEEGAANDAGNDIPSRKNGPSKEDLKHKTINKEEL